MYVQYTFQQMIDQSVTVLTRPSEASFARQARGGDALNAAKYVGAAALFGALLGWAAALIFGLGTGNVLVLLVRALTGTVDTLLSFFFFVFLVHLIGQYQGGLGSFDELSYAFALFIAPIAVLTQLATLLLLVSAAELIPFLELIRWIAYCVFAWLATRAMLRQRSVRDTLITLGGAVLAVVLLRIIFSGTLSVGGL